ncbi:MAG TPA: sigma-70 family RNA polymerase sigma factor [Anaerolineales bacterium]|nr:sigma-70 family RNA polymerase sigma factor [Anaerolineales bacterium]
METELSLLDAAKRLDQEALVKIFDLYASPLYKYALRLCGDPLLADHIVGDVFAKLLDQLSSGNGPRSNLRSYLYQAAYHIIVDEVRSSQRQAPLDTLSSLSAGVPGFEDRIMFEKVLDAIRHDLTDDQRDVVILRFLEEFSLRETAAILGKEVNHVKVIQTRAIAKIRKVFETSEMRAALALPRIQEVPQPLDIRQLGSP